MSITSTQIAAEVIANLELDSSADTTRFKVYESMNSAQLEILNTLPVALIPEMVKTATAVDFVANTATYALENDFLRMVEARVDYVTAISATNKGAKALEYMSDQHSLPIEEIGTQDYPFFSLEHDGLIEVAPVPTGARTAGLQYKYIYQPASALSSGVDSDLDARFKNLMIYKATALSALIEGSYAALHDKYNALYADELQRFMP